MSLFNPEGSDSLEVLEFSPDGKRILFVRGDGFNYRILSVRLYGKGLKLVTAGEEGRRFAVHDPDQQPK